MQSSCEHIASTKPAPLHQQHLKKHFPNHLCLYSTIFSSQNHSCTSEVQLLGLQELFLSSPSFLKRPARTSQTAPSALGSSPAHCPCKAALLSTWQEELTWKRGHNPRFPGFSLTDLWLSETETPQVLQLLHTLPAPQTCIFPFHHPLTTPKA